MFGDDNKDTSTQNNTQSATAPAEPSTGLHGFTMDQPAASPATPATPANDASNPAIPADNPALPTTPMPPEEPVNSFPPAPTEPVSSPAEPTGAPIANDKPAEPVMDTSLPEIPAEASDSTSPTQDNAAPSDSSEIDSQDDDFPAQDNGSNPDEDSSAVSATDDDDGLVNIKQQALQQLSPIVSHLDQTPEEKFRTIMMMIQASDDESLIQSAYDTAQQITDEKAKAQALLDVVNEINYFTQQKSED